MQFKSQYLLKNPNFFLNKLCRLTVEQVCCLVCLQVIRWTPLALRSVRWTQTLTWRIRAEEADSALLWWVRRARPAQRTTRWVPERVWTWADSFQRPSQSRAPVQSRRQTTHRKPTPSRSQISKTREAKILQMCSFCMYMLIPKSQNNKIYLHLRFWLTGELIWPLSDL